MDLGKAFPGDRPTYRCGKEAHGKLFEAHKNLRDRCKTSALGGLSYDAGFELLRTCNDGISSDLAASYARFL